MTRSTVGGRLDWAALATLAGADRSQVPDRDTARIAARELRARGLTVHDIAAALRLSAGAVRDLLTDPQPSPPTAPLEHP